MGVNLERGCSLDWFRKLFPKQRGATQPVSPARSDDRVRPEALDFGTPPDAWMLHRAVAELKRAVPSEARILILKIESALREVPPSDLMRLDHEWRRVSWDDKPLNAASVAEHSRGSVSVAGLLSMSSSGHMREAALRNLSNSTDGTEIPFALIRLNDWVEPVRDVAANLVRERVRPENVAHFVRCLSLIGLLKTQSRARESTTLQRIDELLGYQGAVEPLRRALVSAERRTRRLALDYLLQSASPSELWSLGEGDLCQDPFARHRIAQALSQRAGIEELLGLLERMARDRSPMIRRQALLAYHDRLPGQVEPLHAAVLDRHPAVRATARFLLRDSVTDFASIYRNVLSDDTADRRRTVTAISGLGETGNRSDVPAVLARWSHPDRRIQKAAFKAVAMLDEDAASSIAEKAIRDPDHPFVMQAVRYLSAKPHRIRASFIDDLLKHPSPITRTAAAYLAGKIDMVG